MPFKEGLYRFMSVSGEEQMCLGQFEIRFGEIVYSDQRSVENISDTFAAGPISEYTSLQIQRYLCGGYCTYLRYAGLDA